MNQRIDVEQSQKYIKQLQELKDKSSFLQTYSKLGIPPPSLNGGLYTGEPFHENAPHANIPIIPNTGYMIHYGLRSANPPTEALYQYPDNLRPGNNTPLMPGVSEFANGKYGLLCQNSPRPKRNNSCNCPKCSCHKYYYL